MFIALNLIIVFVLIINLFIHIEIKQLDYLLMHKLRRLCRLFGDFYVDVSLHGIINNGLFSQYIINVVVTSLCLIYIVLIFKNCILERIVIFALVTKASNIFYSQLNIKNIAINCLDNLHR